MFGSVVLEIPKHAFEHEFEAVKKREGREARHRPRRGRAARGRRALQEGREDRRPASRSRRIRTSSCDGAQRRVPVVEQPARQGVPPHLRHPRFIGTAVNVQMMVFGNTGDTLGTGVGFTRNPATGEKEFYGEFLVNAQGEDVVAGIRTPQPIVELEKVMPQGLQAAARDHDAAREALPDIQDFEFTIQDEKLYMLQTRSGKRTGLRGRRDRDRHGAREALITPKEAVLLVDPEGAVQLLAPGLRPEGVGAGSRW
jgi:pyruvate, orthophosphate dikinase